MTSPEPVSPDSGGPPPRRGAASPLARILPEVDDRWMAHWPMMLLGLVILYNVLPGAYGEYVVSVAVLGSMFAIGALGLNVHYGFAGLLNFGHVMFLMVGAYTTALLVSGRGMNIFLAMLIGAVVASVLGLVVGAFSLRLRTDYLAIVTIAMAEMGRVIIKNSGSFRVDPLTGSGKTIGTGGVFGVQNFSSGFNSFLDTTLPFVNSHAWQLFIFNAVVITIILYMTWTLRRSPWGRALRAIREDEDIAAALGKPTFLLKLQAFAVGGFIGAFAGVAFALNNNFIDPDTWLPIFTFRIWIAMIMGGAGTIFGPVLGAMLLQSIFSLVRFLPNIAASPLFGWIPESLVSSNRIFALQGMLLGLLIMLVVIFRPQGVLGSREDLILEGT
ncbi:MAG TPA: branched-chain amino acid ABC transporter permease [Acidimicrobiales bacterium]|nr:branched-chain amino acid ABC transporter permease [Acidimicrobiales bacterium]